MFGERYIVQKGDNLWKIAAATLGRGKEWPRIWRYNNRREVVRVTGRRINDPDRIYVGQLLLIPRLTTLPVARAAAGTESPPSGLRSAEDGMAGAARDLRVEPTPAPNPATPLADQLRRLKTLLIFRFKLGEHALPPQDIGTAVIELKMSGEVLLRTRETYSPSVLVSREDLEVQISREANHAFGTLVSEQKFTYDPSTKKVTLSSMLISQSNVPNSVAVAVGTEVSSGSPIPKLKAEIKLPTLGGTISGFEYVAVDVSVALEITPRPPTTTARDLRLESPEPVQVTSSQPVNPWVFVLGAGLVVGIGIVWGANIVEDVATGGVGLANDAILFSATGPVLARALAMMGVAATVGLPKADPARVQVRATVTTKGSTL